MLNYTIQKDVLQTKQRNAEIKPGYLNEQLFQYCGILSNIMFMAHSSPVNFM